MGNGGRAIFIARKAIDGDTSLCSWADTWDRTSTLESNAEIVGYSRDSWWQVDLGSYEEILVVEISVGTTWEVRVSLYVDGILSSEAHSLGAGSTKNITCNRGGRVLKVEGLNDVAYNENGPWVSRGLTLCEVTVLSGPGPGWGPYEPISALMGP